MFFYQKKVGIGIDLSMPLIPWVCLHFRQGRIVACQSGKGLKALKLLAAKAKIYLALSDQQVMIKNIHLPVAMNDKSFMHYLLLSAEDFFAVSLSALAYDFYFLDAKTVKVVAGKKSSLQQHCLHLSDHGFEVKAVEIERLALLRVCKVLGLPIKMVLLHIADDRIYFYVLEHHAVRFVIDATDFNDEMACCQFIHRAKETYANSLPNAVYYSGKYHPLLIHACQMLLSVSPKGLLVDIHLDPLFSLAYGLALRGKNDDN